MPALHLIQNSISIWCYNDSRNGNADVFGVILDEAGNIVKGDFAVNNSKGDQINAYACYNSTDDTYLISWEDFRNVKYLAG